MISTRRRTACLPSREANSIPTGRTENHIIYIFELLMTNMARPKKQKIKIVESKIKSIEQTGKPVGQTLEKELEQESKEQFHEFISTGKMKAPVLETGQNVQNIETPTEQKQTANTTETGRGAQINPEFSVYEMARTVGRTETRASRAKYEAMTHGGDPVMMKTINAQRPNETATIMNDRRAGFVNPELERLNAGREDYYGVKIEKEEKKKDTRMPWET